MIFTEIIGLCLDMVEHGTQLIPKNTPITGAAIRDLIPNTLMLMVTERLI